MNSKPLYSYSLAHLHIRYIRRRITIAETHYKGHDLSYRVIKYLYTLTLHLSTIVNFKCNPRGVLVQCQIASTSNDQEIVEKMYTTMHYGVPCLHYVLYKIMLFSILTNKIDKLFDYHYNLVVSRNIYAKLSILNGNGYTCMF